MRSSDSGTGVPRLREGGAIAGAIQPKRHVEGWRCPALGLRQLAPARHAPRCHPWQQQVRLVACRGHATEFLSGCACITVIFSAITSRLRTPMHEYHNSLKLYPCDGENN